MSSVVSFRVPASTANLGAGFDALSLALARYLRCSVSASDCLKIEAAGVDFERIPTTAENLICQVAANTAKRRGKTLPPYHLKIDNGIPLARGMGSSAAAIIAGITIYEIMAKDPLDEQELFRCAFDFESHPDNLSAALYGGLVSGVSDDDATVLVARLKIHGDAVAVVVIPSFELSTGKARAVLPKTYTLHDVIYNLQRSALTIAALTTGNFSLLREGMRDRVHQPYRAALIPGFTQILELNTEGLLGVALSGAGPTVFAFSTPDRAEAVGQAIAAEFARHGVESTPHRINIDNTGRQFES